MQSQRGRAARIEWNRPRLTDILVSGTLYYLLHLQPQVHELIAAAVGLAALRCFQIHRV
ncbi:hypothetical protein [Streptomyces achromogenes]|uniref:hypothetical protein n=1 Tax=Streptomyces achromogenes TaxID=67255 RepID=UPI0033DD69B0